MSDFVGPKQPSHSADPRAADLTPKVTIEIDGMGVVDEVTEYSITADCMNIGNPFRLVLANPDGRLSKQIKRSFGSVGGLRGQRCQVFMADPSVNNGAEVRRLVGRVISIEQRSGERGETINLDGMDLGWHLTQCHVPYWKRLNGMSFARLVSTLVDPSWGIGTDTRFDNLADRKISQGRAGFQYVIQGENAPKRFIVPIQTEPGSAAADYLIDYARRARQLVTVGSDGTLQLFAPNDDGNSEYELHYHPIGSKQRDKNNVKAARVTHRVDGLYTKTTCLSAALLPPRDNDTESPNINTYRASYDPPNPSSIVPFTRPFYFSDQDQMSTTARANRARWKWQRGQFDSTQADYTVKGHGQGGIYWVPDAVCYVADEVHEQVGNMWIQSVTYNRDMREGTTTQLTLRPVGLLSA